MRAGRDPKVQNFEVESPKPPDYSSVPLRDALQELKAQESGSAFGD